MDACDGGSSGMGYPNEGSKPPNASDTFLSSGWDPISSLTQPPQLQHQHYPYPPPIWDNQLIIRNRTPELPQYQCESNFLGLQNFVNRGLPKMVGSFGPMSNSSNYGEGTQVRASSQECRNSEEEEEGIVSQSNESIRKRSNESSSPYDTNKNNEGDVTKHPPDNDSDVPKERSEKKQRTERGSSRGKQNSKQMKEDSDSGDAPKDNYIHVRARSGQATNSHSLAERLRREKISERMRLLQELVPGCNKITGKAVMLDEIINYVQSLQQQVEFLSMKLATLNPDLSIDLERALTKEVLHSQHGALPYAQGIFQGAMPSVSSTSQYPSFPQDQLESELQTLFQMGFDSSSAMDFLKSNARLKSEP